MPIITLFSSPVTTIVKRSKLHQLLSFISFIFIVITIVPCQTITADELILRDGSRLVGKVLQRKKAKTQKNSVLEFKTDYAGVIKVKWHQIVEIQADDAMEFMLVDDSIVSVNHVVNNTEDMIVKDETGKITQTFRQDVIAVINPKPWQKGVGYEFSGRVNLAFERDRGNTDEDELDISTDMQWRGKQGGKQDRFTVNGELEYDKANNKKTKDKWKLEMNYNYYLSQNWFTGGFGRFEQDQFSDLDLRSSVGPSLGYQWFESKELNLRASTGLAYTSEDFISEADDEYISLPWSINYDQLLFDGLVQVYHRQIAFWNLENSSDLVWDTWTGLRFPLKYGFVASIELQGEYDSGAADNADDLDTTFYFKVGYEW